MVLREKQKPVVEKILKNIEIRKSGLLAFTQDLEKHA